MMFRYFFVTLVFMQTVPLFADATGIVFQVENRCRAVNLTSGLRYATPCNFEIVKLIADSPTPVAGDHILRRMSFQDRLKVNFRCESLVPVSLKWSVGEASGSISPTQTAALDQNLLGLYEPSLLQMTFVNPPGIQYFKPGCMIEVVEHYKSIDPKGVDAYLGQAIKYKTALERIFQNLSPDQSWSSLIDSIDQATLILDFMQTSADPITAEQIQATLLQLDASKSSITEACSAGSAAMLCSARTRESRELISATIGESRTELNDIAAFLTAEIERLSRIPLTAPTVDKLRAVLTKHKFGG